MKAILSNLSHQVDHEDLLRLIASDLYEEIIKECKVAARYGHKRILSIDVTRLDPYKWIPKECHERVHGHLHDLLSREKLLVSSHASIVNVGWTGGDEPCVPRITTRDLIDLGITDTTLYGEILKQLKTAIVSGDVSADTQQAQLLWVKRRYQRK